MMHVYIRGRFLLSSVKLLFLWLCFFGSFSSFLFLRLSAKCAKTTPAQNAQKQPQCKKHTTPVQKAHNPSAKSAKTTPVFLNTLNLNGIVKTQFYSIFNQN
jgi:hypothetical protein